MIYPKDIAGIKLNGIHPLGASLRSFRATHPASELIIFKSDVGTVYHQMPMHFLYQLLNFITIDNECPVDWYNNFRKCESQKIWQSFMSLVM